MEAAKKPSLVVSPKVKTIDLDIKDEDKYVSEKVEDVSDTIKMVYGDKSTIDKSDTKSRFEDHETEFLRKQNEFKQEQKNRKEQDKHMMDRKSTLGDLDNMGYNINGSLMFTDLNDLSGGINGSSSGSSMDDFFKPLTA